MHTHNLSHINYTDAYYLLEQEVTKGFVTKLPQHEAFGYVTKGKENSLIVHFIRKSNDDDFQNDINNGFIVKGLVLPAEAILSKSKGGFIKGLNLLKTNQEISLTWSDVLYTGNDTRDECPIMYTEGIVFRNNADHIVLKNSETVRIQPTPIKNHPATKPLYYIIPKSFIKSFQYIKNS